MARGDIQTPYDDAVVPTPDGSASGGNDVTGGFDLPDGRKETPNMSSLPPLITTVNPTGEGNPGTDGQVDMPPVSSPGTIPTGEV